MSSFSPLRNLFCFILNFYHFLPFFFAPPLDPLGSGVGVGCSDLIGSSSLFGGSSSFRPNFTVKSGPAAKCTSNSSTNAFFLRSGIASPDFFSLDFLLAGGYSSRNNYAMVLGFFSRMSKLLSLLRSSESCTSTKFSSSGFLGSPFLPFASFLSAPPFFASLAGGAGSGSASSLYAASLFFFSSSSACSTKIFTSASSNLKNSFLTKY